jgi:hypothetical protein
MTNRRSFLAGLVAAAAAPAFVRSESLMKLWVPPHLQDADPGRHWRMSVDITPGTGDFTALVMLTSGGIIYNTGRIDERGILRFPKIAVPAGTLIDEVLVRYTGPQAKEPVVFATTMTGLPL